MYSSIRTAAALVCGTTTIFSVSTALHAQQAASVRSVQVMGNRTPLEIEIEGSDRLVPQAQVLTGPDRLVVDFANATPAAQLRNQKVGRTEVKGVRVGLLSAKPPVTRVVFDLNGPQAYQIFPSGRTVMIKLGSGGGLQNANLAPAHSGAQLVTASYSSTQSLQITPPEPPPLVVSFNGGLLSINSNKASLSEVLYAIHQRTGAEIAIPAGAEQEKVVAAIGPASAPEVLSRLLNGSKFNFVILNSANDPSSLERVILSTKPEGPAPAYHPAPQAPVQQDEPPPPPVEVNNPPPTPSGPPTPGNAPEVKNPPNGENPE